ncbi:hypothetical protein ID866_3065 [Astraeus odoratus]|nr:hypothetical protein ID866_3065 [Astraeus odoratus]
MCAASTSCSVRSSGDAPSRGSPKNDPTAKGLVQEGEFSAPQRTAAEIAREKKLRDDPMAEVHGPLFVTCRRCGNRIKLSPKSSYDPFHWTKHRERCLKKPVGQARPLARRPPKDVRASPAPKKSPPSSSNTDGDNMTPPPLTPEDERINATHIIRERSLSPHDGDIASRRFVHELDSTLREYLDRSQRPSPKTLPVHERWQSWNWSELRYPKWITDTNSMLVDDNEGNGDDNDGDSPSDVNAERLPAIKLLPRPGTCDQNSPSLPT